MQDDLLKEARAEGFARGLLKSAINPTAALQDALKIVYNPASKNTLAALGQDVFRGTRQSNPLKSLGAFLYPRYDQIRTIQAARDRAASAIRAAAPHARETVQAAHASKLRDLYAELGAVAEPRIRFTRMAAPVAGGVGLAGVGGLAYGHMRGQGEADSQLRQQVEQMPILKRIQYALFPNSIPQRPPFYEGFLR